MGNSFSVLPNDDDTYDSDISKKVDNIAINYILTQNSIDLLRLTDKEYYDNLVILTANILKENLNNLELGIVNDRIKYGKGINTDNKVLIKKSNNLREISIDNEKVKEKVLHYISKYYVKILTIYSAIVSTTDPKYVYETEEGKQIFSLKDYTDYTKIDPEKQTIKLYQLSNPVGLIKRRLLILKNKLDGENGEMITINPGEKFCNMNLPGENGESMKLHNEIGIQELDALYYDKYSYETKSWSNMSDKMKDTYKSDLDKFYKAFTGRLTRPETIQSFKDIELLEYHNLPRCKNQDYFKDIVISKNNEDAVKYLEKIDEINNMNYRYKQRLLHILKILFLVEEEGGFMEEKKSRIVINPDLTLDDIVDLQDKVRKIILQMYIHCEYTFIQALIIYERMYESEFGKMNTETIPEQLQTNTNSVPILPINTSSPNTESLNVDTNSSNSTTVYNSFNTVNQSTIQEQATPQTITPVNSLIETQQSPIETPIESPEINPIISPAPVPVPVNNIINTNNESSEELKETISNTIIPASEPLIQDPFDLDNQQNINKKPVFNQQSNTKFVLKQGLNGNSANTNSEQTTPNTVQTQQNQQSLPQPNEQQDINVDEKRTNTNTFKVIESEQPKKGNFFTKIQNMFNVNNSKTELQPEEQPEEQPVQQPTEQPVQQPTEQPVQQPTEQPVQQPTEQPVQQPTEQLVQQPTEQLVQQPTEQPVQQQVQPPPPPPQQPQLTQNNEEVEVFENSPNDIEQQEEFKNN